jgi:hypothetical protein
MNKRRLVLWLLAIAALPVLAKAQSLPDLEDSPGRLQRQPPPNWTSRTLVRRRPPSSTITSSMRSAVSHRWRRIGGWD